MFGQATYLVFFLFVAGALSVPFKLRSGFDTGVSGSTGITAGAGINLNRKDGLLFDYKGNVILGGNARGEAHAGGFGEFNDKKIAGQAEAHGIIRGKGRNTIEGEIGVDSHGNAALSGVNQATLSGGLGGGGTFAAGTNEDAQELMQSMRHGSDARSLLNSDY